MRLRKYVIGMSLASFGFLIGCGPKYGEITGKVIDRHTREPIADVRVTLEEPGLQTFTGPDGGYRFLNVAPGTYTIGGWKEHFGSPRPQPVTVQAGSPTRAQEIEMWCSSPDCARAYGNRILATARDRYTGQSLAGVRVRLRSGVRDVTRVTGKEGSFSFDGLLPGEQCSLAFSLEDFSTEERRAKLKDTVQQTVTVGAELFCVVPECASAYGNVLTGVVVDRYTQAPLEGVQVRLRSGITELTGTTDVGGKYTLRNLLPHERYDLLFSLANFSILSDSVDLMGKTQQRMQVDGELFCVSRACADRYHLTAGGRIIDFRTKRPLVGATVVAEIEHQSASARETLEVDCDQMGAFKIFDLLPNDRVAIRVREPGKVEAAGWRTVFTAPDQTDHDTDLGVIDLLYGGRFYESTEGTILDVDSRLLWIKDPSVCGAEFGTLGSPAAVTRQAADQACENLTYAGYSDWRLPTFGEMAGLYEGLGKLTKAKDRRVEPFVWASGKNGTYWVSDRTTATVRHFDFAVGPGVSGWAPDDPRLWVTGYPFVRPVRSAD